MMATPVCRSGAQTPETLLHLRLTLSAGFGTDECVGNTVKECGSGNTVTLGECSGSARLTGTCPGSGGGEPSGGETQGNFSLSRGLNNAGFSLSLGGSDPLSSIGGFLAVVLLLYCLCKCCCDKKSRRYCK